MEDTRLLSLVTTLCSRKRRLSRLDTRLAYSASFVYEDQVHTNDHNKMAAHRPIDAKTSNDVDANVLFEKHTIQEIRDLEKKTRSDIEKKKEDLRVMVGERYRDLIDAADTITDMKTSAENVMTSIAQMEMLCTAMRQKHMLHGASFHVQVKNEVNRNTDEMEFYGTAAQIKLLMDFPEKIWSSVDCQDYLKATQLYLLARHINTSLHLDSRRSSDVITWFPVLTRQWTAISHFKNTILQGCRALLCDTDADWSDQQMTDVLCSIILLEDSTPRQVFTEFLLARTKALQEILHSGQQSNVKLQITGVARLLTSTLRQIYSVFFCENDQHQIQQEGSAKGDETKETTGLLLATLNRVVSTPSQDNLKLELHGSISSRCLPNSVKQFKPLLKTPATPLQTKQLRDNCQQWMNTCLQEVQSGVGKLLSFVNSVKRVADIRDSLWELLTKVEAWDCWKQIRAKIVPMMVWEDFLKPLFVDRVQALIQYQLETTAELMKRTISKAMMELTSDMNDSAMQCERNLASFVWTESPADIIMADIWQAASTKTLMDCGGLMLKARAFTPAVQNLCQSVDEKLKLLLEDTESYVQAVDSEQRHDSNVFDRFADTPDILKFMQQSGVKCVQEILSYLTEQLRLWEKSLTDIPDPITSAITENKVLLTARTCAAMSEMTPHLQRCILALPEWNKHASFKLTKKLRSQKPSELPEWNSIHLKLQQCQMTAYRIWMDYTYKQIISGFSEQISSVDQNILLTSLTVKLRHSIAGLPGNVLPSTLYLLSHKRWEEVQITEEAEEGKQFSSKIFVPMQASWHVQTLLYRLCDDLNKIGIQALPRSVVQNLLVKVTDCLVSAYEELLKARGQRKCTYPLSQPEVLQELFNFKFIQLIIPRKGEEEIHRKYQQRCQSVLSQLEDIVDPFDLDVFSPFIQANLSKQAQRSSVIFGALCHLDKLGGAGVGSAGGSLSGGLRPVLTGQEPHNVLSLISCPNRFPLLPLGSQHGNRGGGSSALITQPLKAQSMSRTPEANGPSLTSVVESTLPSSSSQADLSSSFYDKMEKLGSMGSRIFSNISGKS